MEALLGLDGLQIIGQHGSGAVGHHLAGGACALLGLLHGAEVRQEAQRHKQHHQNGQDTVQLIGHSVNNGVLALLGGGKGAEAHQQARHVDAPRGKRQHDALRSGGGIADPCQLLAGDLGLIGDGPHDVAHEQRREVVAEEDQHAQRPGQDLRQPLRDPQLAVQRVGHGVDRAGFLEKGHHDADKHLDADGPDKVGIAQRVLHQSRKAEQQIVARDQNAHQNTAQDGDKSFPRDKRQNDGNQRRSQRKDPIVFHNCLLVFVCRVCFCDISPYSNIRELSRIRRGSTPAYPAP